MHIYSFCTNYNIYNEYILRLRQMYIALLSLPLLALSCLSPLLLYLTRIYHIRHCLFYLFYTFLLSVCFKLPLRYFFLSVSIYSHIIFDSSRYRHPTPYILRLSCLPFLTSLQVQHFITYLLLVSLLFTPSFPYLLPCFFYSSTHSISFPLYPPVLSCFHLVP